MEILKVIWSALNTPAGVAMVAAALLWLLNKLYAKKPDWKAYEGTIIAAIKKAEKTIPDDNASLAKFDAALKYFLAVYEKSNGKVPPAELVNSVKEGISVVHASLEANGNL